MRSVVTGSLRVRGGELRLTLEIVDPETRASRATRTYAAKIDDLAPTLARAARELAADLGVPHAPRAADRATAKPAAHRAYLQGRHAWNQRNEAALRRAIQYFEEATREDPSYAAAWAAIAEAWLVLPIVSTTPVATAVEKAKPNVERALAIDPGLSQAHSARANILEYAWDYPAAEASHRRALDADPNNPVAHQWYAEMLMTLRRFDEAVMHMNRALEIDPLSAPIHRNFGMVLLYAKRYAEAEKVLEKSLELDPQQPLSRLYLALVAMETDRPDLALRRLHEDPMLAPAAMRGFLRVNEIYAHARAGKKEAAGKLAVLPETLAIFEADPMLRAVAEACLGHVEKMLAALDRAIEAHVRLAPFVNVMQPFDPYRSDPRFVERLKRIGLPTGG